MAKFRFDMNKPGAALGGALAQMPSTQRPAQPLPLRPGQNIGDFGRRPAIPAPLPPNAPVFQPRPPERRPNVPVNRPPMAPPVQGRPQDNVNILPYPMPEQRPGDYRIQPYPYPGQFQNINQFSQEDLQRQMDDLRQINQNGGSQLELPPQPQLSPEEINQQQRQDLLDRMRGGGRLKFGGGMPRPSFRPRLPGFRRPF